MSQMAGAISCLKVLRKKGPRWLLGPKADPPGPEALPGTAIGCSNSAMPWGNGSITSMFIYLYFYFYLVFSI